MSKFTIPAGTCVDVAPASELHKVRDGLPVTWREHVTRVELTFERNEHTRNAGCFFFVHDRWLIRVGRGETIYERPPPIVERTPEEAKWEWVGKRSSRRRR